jgi:hypothetical protein
MRQGCIRGGFQADFITKLKDKLKEIELDQNLCSPARPAGMRAAAYSWM